MFKDLCIAIHFEELSRIDVALARLGIERQEVPSKLSAILLRLAIHIRLIALGETVNEKPMPRLTSRHDRPKATTLSLTISSNALLHQTAAEPRIDQSLHHLAHSSTQIGFRKPVLIHPTPEPTHHVHRHIDLRASLR
jgi:hypothetical protein